MKNKLNDHNLCSVSVTHQAFYFFTSQVSHVWYEPEIYRLHPLIICAAENGSVDYEKKMLLMKYTSVDDMGAPCITPWIQDIIIFIFDDFRVIFGYNYKSVK